MRAIELEAGQRFGRLTVVGIGEPYMDARGWAQRRWLVRCDCGEERNVWASALRSGASASCGCWRVEGLRRAAPKQRLDVVSYFGMHCRIRRERGKASDKTCVDCGEAAHQWSYDGLDPDELHYDPPGKRRLSYSLDQNHYAPRCASCHYRRDGITPPWHKKRQS